MRICDERRHKQWKKLSKPYPSFLRVPFEGRDVLKLDLVGFGRTGEAGLAEDDLLVNRAGH